MPDRNNAVHNNRSPDHIRSHTGRMPPPLSHRLQCPGRTLVQTHHGAAAGVIMEAVAPRAATAATIKIVLFMDVPF
jgi:hypothetical protein